MNELLMYDTMLLALTEYFDQSVTEYRGRPDHYSKATPFGRLHRNNLAHKLWAMRRAIVNTRKAQSAEWLRAAA